MNPVVIIVTYNGMQWLDKCLSSIRTSDIALETIIVDNGSTDGSIEFIESRFPEVTLIKSPSNLGFGKANNIGISEAIKRGTAYVYLMNQDAWVEPSTISTLISEMKKQPDFGILSPMQLTGSGTSLDANFEEFSSSRVPNNEYREDAKQGRVKTLYQVPFVMAAHWLVNVEFLRITGGFSHAFPHYGEDNNLVHRFLYFGYKVGICPFAKAYHDREFRKRSVEKLAYTARVVLTIKLNDLNKGGLIYFIKSYFQFLRFLIGKTRFRLDLSLSSIIKSYSIMGEAKKYRRITLENKGCFL